MKRSVSFLALGILLIALSAPVYSQSSVRFAAVGDFNVSSNSQSVATMISTWNPDVVITVGDNNYTNVGTTAGWDNAVGQYFGAYIKYPAGSTSTYKPGPATNKFFPSLGNHDLDATGFGAYFDLPNNERYYDFVKGPVHFFVINSDSRETDGIASNSAQALWLQARLAASTAKWKIVYFHHPPYSSSTTHGSTAELQWPFQAWGATAVFSGHDHTYERIVRNGFPYFITGWGGNGLYAFGTPVTGSAVRYNTTYGAMLMDADNSSITFKAYSIAGGGSGTLVDTYTINADPPSGSVLIPAGATWKYLDNGSNQGTAWTGSAFNDGAWSSGPAELGYNTDNTEPAEATVIGYGPDINNKYVTSYFRRSFTVTDPSAYTSLLMQLIRDDGAVVYLNGTEVYRANMPAGAVSYTTLASAAISNADETTFLKTTIPANLLVSGTNVIAVEMHQSSVTSTDISFNLSLEQNSPPTASNVNVTGTPVVGQVLTANYTYSDADGDAQGTPTYRWLRTNVAIAGATAATYTLVAGDAGTMIKCEVTPVALTGITPGTAVQSAEVGPVTAATGNGAYRSVASGNWSAAGTWETYNGSIWSPAGVAPTSASGVVTVRNPHTVTVTANVTVDQVVVEAGAQVTLNTGITLTIANGTGTDMSVSGILRNSGTVTTTGTLAFNAGGKYQHDFNGDGTIPSATWDIASTCEIIGITSGTTRPTGLTQTFGNFTWNCPAQTGVQSTAGELANVTGTLTVANTGSGTFALGQTTAFSVLSVGQNFVQSAGNFRLASTGKRRMTVGGTFSVNGGAVIMSDGASAGQGGTRINVSGAFSINSGASLSMNPNANGTPDSLQVGGNWTNSGTFSAGTGMVTFAGPGTQTAGGTSVTTFNHLTVNNAAGITLNTDETVNGILLLTSGNVTTGSHAMIIGPAGSINRTSGHIVGNLRMNIATGDLPAKTFHIGTAAAYTPATVDIDGAGGTAGTITGSTTGSAHADVANSGLDQTKDIERFWTMTPGGGAALGGRTYKLKAEFLAGDASGMNTSTFEIRRKDGSSGVWSAPAGGSYTRTGTTTEYSTFTSFSDFAIGTPVGIVTYAISGNAGIGGATLSYTDGSPASVTADGAGLYTLNVSANWSGTVTPSKTGYTFTPPNRVYSNVQANTPGQNYTATLNPSGPILILPGATWKYLDNGSNQGTAWTGLAFNDGAWSSGPAELGYNTDNTEPAEATVIGYGPDINNKYITSYFRHSFIVTDPSAYTSLLMRLIRDDGPVVYLNGTEVYRDNMPAGPVTYTTLATAAIGNAAETTYVQATIPANLLVSGTNVIAVEMHQSSVTSTDISFKLALGQNSPPVASNVNVTGTPMVGQVLTANYTYSDADGDAQGTPTYRWLRTNVAIAGATAATYTLVAGDAGTMIKCEVTPVALTGITPGTAVQSAEVGPVTAATGSGAYRSVASGNWNAAGTWETYNGSIWGPAGIPPTNSSDVTTIRSPHTVTVTANASADQVVVDAGAQVTVNNGITFTIANGSGTDMSVSGILRNSGTVTTTGTLAFNAGGKYQHDFTTTQGTIPTATWNAASTCEVIGYTTYTGGSSPAGAGQTFGNVVWNCPNQTAAVWNSGLTTQINGSLTVLSTGATGSYALGQGSSSNLAITGDLTVSAGEFQVSISGTRTVTVAGNLVQNGGTFTLTNGTGRTTLDVNGNVSINSGTFRSLNTGTVPDTVRLGGNWTNTGTLTPGTSTFVLDGTSAQSMTGSTFNNLTINNAAGITLNSDETVNGTLRLISGNVTTGSHAMIIGPAGTINRTNGHIVGNLRMNIATGDLAAMTFPLGSAAAYTPATVDIDGTGGTAGTITGSVTGSAHPDIANSGLNQAKDIERYWTLTPGGGAALGGRTYKLKAEFLAGDASGMNTGTFEFRRKDGSSGVWSAPTGGSYTRTGTSTEYSSFNSFSDFAVGVSANRISKFFVSTSGNDATGDGTAGNPFRTIQKGIDVAGSTDTVQVAAGQYIEMINVNKSLFLIGAGAGTTSIVAPVDFGTRRDHDYTLVNLGATFGTERAIVHIGAATPIQVLMTGFTVDGMQRGPNLAQQVAYSGILAEQCEVSILNNTVKNMLPADPGSVWHEERLYNGRGIHVRGSGSIATIDGNTLQEINRFHILINATDDNSSLPAVFPVATVSNNTLVGKGTYAGGQKGIWFNTGAWGTISGNTISAMDYANPVIEPERASAIVVRFGHNDPTHRRIIKNNIISASSSTNNKGIYVQGIGDSVADNTITGYRWGIEVHDGHQVHLARNTITGGWIGVLVTTEHTPGTSDQVVIGGSAADQNIIKDQAAASAGGYAISMSFRDPLDIVDFRSPIPVDARYNDFGVYTSAGVRGRIWDRADTVWTAGAPVVDTVLYYPFYSPLPPWAISGNAGVAGATMSFTDVTPQTATADGSGNYTVHVRAGWSGTVMPGKTGYVFDPTGSSYTDVSSNITGQNYTASPAPIAVWTAYNDVVYRGSDQYIGTNVSTITIGNSNPGPTSGLLRKQSDNSSTGITATLTESGGVTWQPDAVTGGDDPQAGTDAYATFHGITDMGGVVYYSSTTVNWYVDLTFTGLDVGKEYTFATSAVRNSQDADYANRISIYTLSGAASSTNASTSGVTVISPTSVKFVTGDNSTLGYVARWTNIKPGTGGTFSVRAQCDVASRSDGKAYAFSVFMLQETGGTGNYPPDQPICVAPLQGAVNVSLSPSLQVGVSDPEAQNMTVTYYGRSVTGSAGDFTLIALPDAQNYTSSANGGTPAMFTAQTQWCVDNKAVKNIVFVTQLGDITNENGATAWGNASTSMGILESPAPGIPYGIAIGNHDQINPPTLFNNYFGESRFTGRSYYGGHYGADNNNNFELFSASGMDFIIIHLGTGDQTPTPAVLTWADGLLKTYSTRRGIVVHHSILNADGTPASFTGPGQAIYNALQGNANLFLMLCGHNHGEGMRSDIGTNGNTIYSVLSDYQSDANGGNGYMRIMEFSPANNEIRVKTYSPTLLAYQTDANSQFSIAYQMQGSSFQAIGTNTGVASGSTSSMLWPSRAGATQYEWYATASDGNYTITSATWSFTTASPSVTVANVKAFLQGPFAGGSMSASLRALPSFPLSQPYTSAPWSYTGTETVASVPAGVVDWVLVELRTGTALATKVATRAAFIKTDGSVVDMDGTSPVTFPSVSAGSYYIVLRHRNHLGVTSASAVALNASSTLYDFTSAVTMAYGSLSMTGMGTGGIAPFALYSGDADGSGGVGALDRTATWNTRNQTGYLPADVDLSSGVGALDRTATWNNRNRTTQIPN